MKNLPKSRNSNIVVQEMNDETLVYDLNINKAFCLNETSKLVWQLCNGINTAAEIANKLSKQTKQVVSEDVVYLAIEDLNRNGLLENDTSEQFTKHFDGMSRREVIKKVGFASLIALPLISSIIAPTAANAASQGTTANGRTCSTNSQCASNACTNTGGGVNRCCISPTNNNFNGTVANSPNQAACSANAVSQCCTGRATYFSGSTLCYCDSN